MQLRRTSWILSLVFVLGLTAGAKAQTSADCPALIEKAFAVTGLTDAIQSMPEGVRRGAEAALANSPASPVQARRIKAAIMKAVTPAQVDSVFKAEYLRTCDPGSLQSVIAEMSAPLATRMNRLEAMAQNPQIMAAMPAYAASLRQNPVPADRMDLIYRLDTATRGTALTLETLQVSALTVMAWTGRPARANETQVPRDVQEQLHNLILYTYLFTYRDVKDQELTHYVEILEKPAMLNFYQTFGRAFLNTVVLQLNDIGREFVPAAAAGR